MMLSIPWLDNEWGKAFIEEVKPGLWYACFWVDPAARKWVPVEKGVGDWIALLSKLSSDSAEKE